MSTPHIMLPRVETMAPMQHIKNVETHALIPLVTVVDIHKIAVKAEETLSGFLLIYVSIIRAKKIAKNTLAITKYGECELPILLRESSLRSFWEKLLFFCSKFSSMIRL